MAKVPTTVTEYLAKLAPDRCTALQTIRTTILTNLDRDYEEGIQYGMIGYFVPHRVFPAGYHCNPKEPLPYLHLASQKNHLAIYMCSIYMDPAELTWFVEAWKKTGKRLDMGKACIRFKRIEDVPLDVIGAAVRRTPASKYIKAYSAALSTRPQRKKTKPPATRKKTKRVKKKS